MRRFGELEAVIMDRLWERGRPVLVRDVVDALHDDRAPAYTTVMTVMENLGRRAGAPAVGDEQPPRLASCYRI
jgi:predicted transcriptional regulator